MSVESLAEPKRRILIAGGGGFIGSHTAKRLKDQGHWVRIADWKRNEFFEEKDFCDEFLEVDLRELSNCVAATNGCEWVFNFSAGTFRNSELRFSDPFRYGRYGFHSIKPWNDLVQQHVCHFVGLDLTQVFRMISFNMVEAARRCGVKRFFYSSSACIYPEHKQLDTANPGLKESDAWPAAPQDAYGLEKIATEELCKYYGKDFGIEFRVGRFHNIYGPQGTWKGGREKAPAAFCRKARCSTAETGMEMWGDGLQTRSFCYIDDCVEGVLRLFASDFREPLNIGSDEMVSMIDMGKMALEYAGKADSVKIRHIPGPEGVRGRNSDNTLIKQVLGWTPSISLKDGIGRTYKWITEQVDAEEKTGVDVTAAYATSHVVTNRTPEDTVKSAKN